MNYIHLAERPDEQTKEWTAGAYSELCARISGAEASSTSSAWLQLFEDWNALKSYVESEGSRLSYAATKDMTNEQHDARERTHRTEVLPLAEEGDAKMVAALLASKHSKAIADRYGEHLITVLGVGEESLSPKNTKQRVSVGELCNKYDKLVASGEVDVQGEMITLASARAKLSSDDPATRRAAFEAYYGWFLENRDALAQIYAEQVVLRDQMGKQLGYENYLPLGYSGMERTDYGPEEAAAFRASVRKYVVPLSKRLDEEQAALLETPTLRPWDAAYHPTYSLAQGVAKPIDKQLDKMGRVFDKLSPQLAAHFQRMRDEGLIDLENRKGKAAGAYCTSFPDEGRVAIFCNSTGNESDVGTLAHEMGHAFQGWESQAIKAVDLRWPSSDACEIHSMGMEFLCMPYLGEFFQEEDRETFARARWFKAVSLLCYVCIVDEFQHWVYEHAQATADERDAAFVKIRDIYQPGVDWSGEAEPYASTRWYAQLHIFDHPFYYIDYAIAETGAMQLGMLDQADHEGCLETYLELCRLGGTKSLLGLVRGAGLRSPFEPELMRDLMAHAEQQLGI
ncbi:MAG: M3 family oligoendopeptidase [Planctomycetota bacterium]|jgi:M3 family oligoendopeptidase